MSITAWSPQQLKANTDIHDLVLVDMKAPWCPQCEMQLRVLEQLSTELKGQVMFGAVDIGDYPEAGETWQVTTLPTLLIFKQGVLKETLRGYQRTHLITQALKRIAIQTPQTSKVNNSRDS